MTFTAYGDLERGRKLVEESGPEQTRMIDRLDALTYFQHERRLVDHRGECSGGCESTEQTKHYATGRIVCPRTLKPCPGRRLCKLIKLFERVHSR